MRRWRRSGAGQHKGKSIKEKKRQTEKKEWKRPREKKRDRERPACGYSGGDDLHIDGGLPGNHVPTDLHQTFLATQMLHHLVWFQDTPGCSRMLQDASGCFRMLQDDLNMNLKPSFQSSSRQTETSP